MLIVKGYMLIVVMLRGPDSNRRPPGYGPGELPTALPRYNYHSGNKQQITSTKYQPVCNLFFIIYSPMASLVGNGRFELPTSSLSEKRSNQLS